MFSSSQFDGSFSGSQFSQSPDSTLSKTRAAVPGERPVTVKHISEAYDASEDKSNLIIDGADATNVRLLGLVMSKKERATDATFVLDDGTGRIDIIKWTHDASDVKQIAVIQNGMYVVVNGRMKRFQSKMQVDAFFIRPVVDYNEIALHFIQCIHVHAHNTKQKIGGLGPLQSSPIVSSPAPNESKGYQTPVSNKSTVKTATVTNDDDIYKLVLEAFEEPSSVASEHGVHVDEVVRRLGIPANKIKDAINYHVDVGHIYSTIDDYHFKSAC